MSELHEEFRKFRETLVSNPTPQAEGDEFPKEKFLEWARAAHPENYEHEELETALWVWLEALKRGKRDAAEIEEKPERVEFVGVVDQSGLSSLINIPTEKLLGKRVRVTLEEIE